MKAYEDIASYIRSEQQAMIELLGRLVEAESPSSDVRAQLAAQSLLSRAFEESGCRVFRIPGAGRSGGHLYVRPIERIPRRPIQLLIGHSDTVWPIGTLREMPLIVDENTVRGPGVYDMKGGLVQGLFAWKSLRVCGLEPGATPVFFINSDEEIGSPESSRYLKMLARCAVRTFVLEPALGLDGKIKTSRKGGGRFVVQVKGESAHAGLNPGAGASAILELSHVIQKVYALNDLEQGITINVGQIDGGVRPNVVAAESKAVIDVRVRTMADARRIEDALHGLEATTPGTSLSIEGMIGRAPMEPTSRNRALWEAARQTGLELGLSLEEALAGGVSDGNTTSLLTATIDGLGAVGDGAHARHEFLYIDKMIERTTLLAALMLLPADLSLFDPASPKTYLNAPSLKPEP